MSEKLAPALEAEDAACAAFAVERVTRCDCEDRLSSVRESERLPAAADERSRNEFACPESDVEPLGSTESEEYCDAVAARAIESLDASDISCKIVNSLRAKRYSLSGLPLVDYRK